MIEAPLIERDALKGVRIALSVSESADLQRLGLTREHCNLAIAEIARSVFLAGGSILYGGRIKEEGFTHVLMEEALRYSDNRQALLICVPFSEHINLPLREIKRINNRLGASARMMLMGPDGDPMTVAEAAAGGRDETLSPDSASSLTVMRRYVTRNTHARILLGGKLCGYQGIMPGLIEEAMLSMEAHRPVYVGAGFGGAAAAIARCLGRDDLSWVPAKFPEGAEDSHVVAALEDLALAARRNPCGDGLSESERQELSASHRPGTIASHIVQGIARCIPVTDGSAGTA